MAGRPQQPPLQVETVDLETLSPSRREALVDELLELDKAVFPAAQPEDLLRYLDDPRAHAVLVTLYRDAGRLVGQNICPVLRVEVEGRSVDILGSIAGMLPTHRGRSRMQLDACWMTLRRLAEHPLQPLFLVTPMMQPRVYAQFAANTRYLHPRLGRGTPSLERAVLAAAATLHRGIEHRGPAHFVQVGLPAPKATRSERGRIDPDDPHQAFFLQQVPEYVQGAGLLCTMALTPRSIVLATLQLGLNQLRRRLRPTTRRNPQLGAAR